MNLSPYSKTVVSAVGTLVAVVIQFLVGDGADAATLGTAIIGLLTTLGVFRVTNAPLTEKGSLVEPSSHEVTENVVPIKPKPRRVTNKPRPTSKPVKQRATATKSPKKDGE